MFNFIKGREQNKTDSETREGLNEDCLTKKIIITEEAIEHARYHAISMDTILNTLMHCAKKSALREVEIKPHKIKVDT